MDNKEIRKLIAKLKGHILIGVKDEHGVYNCIYQYKNYFLKLSYNEPTKQSVYYVFKDEISQWSGDSILFGHIDNILDYSTIELYTLIKDVLIKNVDNKFKVQKREIIKNSKKAEKEWLKKHQEYLKRNIERF